MKDLLDINGQKLKIGDRVRYKTFKKDRKPNGHVYKTVKWLNTRSMSGWNIVNKKWEKVIK